MRNDIEEDRITLFLKSNFHKNGVVKVRSSRANGHKQETTFSCLCRKKWAFFARKILNCTMKPAIRTICSQLAIFQLAQICFQKSSHKWNSQYANVGLGRSLVQNPLLAILFRTNPFIYLSINSFFIYIIFNKKLYFKF